MTKRRKSDNERYSERISIGVNISQKQLLDELTKKLHTTTSDYIRDLLFTVDNDGNPILNPKLLEE